MCSISNTKNEVCIVLLTCLSLAIDCEWEKFGIVLLLILIWGRFQIKKKSSTCWFLGTGLNKIPFCKKHVVALFCFMSSDWYGDPPKVQKHYRRAGILTFYCTSKQVCKRIVFVLHITFGRIQEKGGGFVVWYFTRELYGLNSYVPPK